MARVLCDNGDNITEATDNVFLLPSLQHGYKSCEEIPGPNLYFWQECDTCNSLPPLLSSYVPQTYHRSKRSAADDPKSVVDFVDTTEERITGLEELINSYQKELKKLKKKLKKLETSCSANTKHQHHHCQDSSGNRRLNNEIWNQDECTKCQCKHPQVTCITERCAPVTCPNNVQPVKYPGECCEQCPSTTPNPEPAVAAWNWEFISDQLFVTTENRLCKLWIEWKQVEIVINCYHRYYKLRTQPFLIDKIYKQILINMRIWTSWGWGYIAEDVGNIFD